MDKILSDKDKMTDSLNSQKYTTEHYNSFANEIATPHLKACVMQILNEEHDIGHEIFSDMSSRGWYPTECAPEDKIQSAKTKFSSPSF